HYFKRKISVQKVCNYFEWFLSKFTEDTNNWKESDRAIITRVHETCRKDILSLTISESDTPKDTEPAGERITGVVSEDTIKNREFAKLLEVYEDLNNLRKKKDSGVFNLFKTKETSDVLFNCKPEGLQMLLENISWLLLPDSLYVLKDENDRDDRDAVGWLEDARKMAYSHFVNIDT